VSREYVDFNTVSLHSYGFVVKFHLGISFPLASKKESRNTNIMATLQLDEIHKFSSSYITKKFTPTNLFLLTCSYATSAGPPHHYLALILFLSGPTSISQPTSESINVINYSFVKLSRLLFSVTMTHSISSSPPRSPRGKIAQETDEGIPMVGVDFLPFSRCFIFSR
jgi:hypothetical protein